MRLPFFGGGTAMSCLRDIRPEKTHKVVACLMPVLLSVTCFLANAQIVTPVAENVTCNNNGTLNTASDDYLTFQLTPPAPTANYESPYTYTVTATQNGAPVSVTLSDGSPATSVPYGRTEPFRLGNGTPGAGNVFLTITPNWGGYAASQAIVPDPGSCVLADCSFGAGNHTLTYTYQSPVRLTEASNWQAYIPKFVESGGRNLTSVQVNIGGTYFTSLIVENRAVNPQTYTASVNSNLIFMLNGSPMATPLLTPYQTSGLTSIGAAVLVPPQGTWAGDDMSAGFPSTVDRMTQGPSGWLLGALDAGLSPFTDPRWVTNATGNPGSDDDINMDGILKEGNYNGSFTYTSAADLANFTGTGQVPLTYSTLSGISATGGGGNLALYQVSSTFFTVSVTYTFTELCPLPVRLTSFKALGVNETVALNWATVGEKNSKGFFVEQSADTKTWESIAWVESKAAGGTAETRLEYRYTDNIPSKPVSYYRLRMLDLDGTYTYSSVASVRTGGAEHIIVSPNPVVNTLTISGVEPASISEVSVTDLSGRELLKGHYPGNGLDLRGVTNGLYVLSVSTISGEVHRVRFVVAK